MAGMEAIAVDWSGSTASNRGRRGARAVDGRLVELTGPLSRDAALAWITACARSAEGPLAVGLDFAFSFPSWFLDEKGYRSPRELWEAVAREGEEWLARCEPPFWGRPGRRRPELPAHFRATEASLPAIAGSRPKSPFQIGGAGSVGTASIRGMPLLPHLSAAGLSIWPFDEPGAAVVVEIWPRLLTGPVVKRDRTARSAYLAARLGAVLDRAVLGRLAESEDAFDAGVSAVVMSRHDELAAPARPAHPDSGREGAIWVPPDAATKAAGTLALSAPQESKPSPIRSSRRSQALRRPPAASAEASDRRVSSTTP